MIEHFPLRGGMACECGWSYGLSLNDTRSDMRLFLNHFGTIVAEEVLTDALHPEFGSEWDGPDGVIYKAVKSAKVEAWDEGHAASERDWQLIFDLSTPDEDRQPLTNPYRGAR